MQSSASSDCSASARSDFDTESSESESEYFDFENNAKQTIEEEALFHLLENYKMPILRGNKSSAAKRGRGGNRGLGNKRTSGRNSVNDVPVHCPEEPVSDHNTTEPVSLSSSTGSVLYNITSDTSPGEISLILNSLSFQVKSLTNQLELRLNEFEKKNEVVSKPPKISSTELKKLQKEMKEVKTNNEQLQQKNRELEEKMESLQQKVELLNTQTRHKEIPNSKKLVLAGTQIASILETSNLTNLKYNIDEFLIRQLELPRDSLRDIKYARLSEESKKVSAIIPEYNIMGSFFKQARLLKPQGISISEHLTPKNAFLKYKLLKFRHEGQYGILSVFSYKGEIYIKKEVNGQRIKIKNITDITGPNAEGNITADGARSQSA